MLLVSLSRYVCWGLALTFHTLEMDWRMLVPPKLVEQRNGHPHYHSNLAWFSRKHAVSQATRSYLHLKKFKKNFKWSSSAALATLLLFQSRMWLMSTIWESVNTEHSPSLQKMLLASAALESEILALPPPNCVFGQIILALWASVLSVKKGRRRINLTDKDPVRSRKWSTQQNVWHIITNH